MAEGFHFGLTGSPLLIVDGHLQDLAGSLGRPEKVVKVTPGIIAHLEVAVILAEEGFRPAQGIGEADSRQPAHQYTEELVPDEVLQLH